MGYFVQIDECDFRILKEHLNDAYKAMCALNHDPNASKGGGSWGPNGKTALWFSWMPENYDETLTSADEILTELGFYTDLTAEGDLAITGYDSKIGDEEQFLDVLVPFVNEDAYIVWRGEDGAVWKWTTKGTLNGVLTFVES